MADFSPLPIDQLPWPGFPVPRLPKPGLNPIDLGDLFGRAGAMLGTLIPRQIPLPPIPGLAQTPVQVLPGQPQQAIPTQPQQRTFGDTHHAFLMLLGEIVGVAVLSFVADTDPDVGKAVVGLMLVLVLVWFVYHADVVNTWTSKVGMA